MPAVKRIAEEIDTTKNVERDKELRKSIKWDIWEEPGVRSNWLKDNYSYNKIQFTYEDTDKGIEMCFLMGFTAATWKMWVGKPGTVSYTDDWAWDLKTDDLRDAIMKSLDVIINFVHTVEADKNNYVAYYVHI